MFFKPTKPATYALSYKPVLKCCFYSMYKLDGINRSGSNHTSLSLTQTQFGCVNNSYGLGNVKNRLKL